MTIIDNDTATAIDLSAGTSMGGDVTIVDNDTATTIDLSAGDSMGGSVTIIDNADADVAIDTPSIDGDLTVSTGGGSVSAPTADGETSVTLANGPATMSAALATGTFMSPVEFSIESVALPTSVGTNPTSSHVVVTPVASYQFNFAIPTLNRDATLIFEIDVRGLSAANRAAFLAALAAGNATLAVKGDAPGSAFQTFAICGAAEPPTAGGCVSLAAFDASGSSVPPGDPSVAVVRFTGITGHFSTFAVVIASTAATIGRNATMSNGTMAIEGLGLPDTTYVLEATTDLAPVMIWTRISTNTATAAGLFQFMDADAAIHPQRFYRVVGH